ncbi:magnesium chelatase subunit D [Silvibacterium bohemicum]|uniref:Magnesium chelatase subunit D n=1 Tax=Silvibacterium bohemicum TaxID=1577686 RepID=A0A841JU54_9BACT|nr:ATP-binding protein [Silvibacterium bohemicum]MBB6144933.1 magnesium chelatase subunit D [Silvibacterium bohemicum]
MRPPIYPFSAIVGQDQMKLALLLAAIDWRLGVLLRGDKGAGKTTTARGLAALLPEPAPFINLPIGATEDRLLGGLHLERTLKGDPVLKPGLLSEAHQGVLYIDEINLLPAHLGDALLDTAASGVNVIEREGLSASHAAEFVLLGSMNPEEGLLRPQLLDRFALSVDIAAPMETGERQRVVERRIAFERDAAQFMNDWTGDQLTLREKISAGRERLSTIVCSGEILAQISTAICDAGVRSLRADLAAVRASIALAALMDDGEVQPQHVETVLPLVLNHRARSGRNHAPPQPPSSSQQPQTPKEDKAQEAIERVFAPRETETPAIRAALNEHSARGNSQTMQTENPGPVVATRRTENPIELDLRATLNHTLLDTGQLHPRLSNLHEKVRQPKTGMRYLLVIDSSGSHAAQEKMRRVKGAAVSLLNRSFRKDDEVAIIVFRGTAAQVLLEPSRIVQDAVTALEYLPTGGRTPLAQALDLAKTYTTESTLLILMTDGRANVGMGAEDPWQEALQIASQLHCSSLVIDTEDAAQPLGRSRELAEALRAEYVALENLQDSDVLQIALPQSARV